jgi:NitT/TauT family transport system substrate-binding protein
MSNITPDSELRRRARRRPPTPIGAGPDRSGRAPSRRAAAGSPVLPALFAVAAACAACEQRGLGASSGPADATPRSPSAESTTSSGYGRPGDPVHLTVGYQPYYAEAWSGVVVNGLGLWKKYLPPGSTVDFNVGLQGSIIVNAMLAGKEEVGYCGDMPAIVGATKRSVADLRIVANIGLSHDQCNVFLTRADAPEFGDASAAVRWLDGKTVAVPKGSCADRFALAVFTKQNITPKEYLNQSIELITSGFRVKKLDAAVVWEPVASRLILEGLARRVATGNDFGENDGAFIDMRADLIEARPDVVKGWLRAELDAELYLADPKNARDVARMAKEQTTGFDERGLWQSLFGTYPASAGGSPTRLVLPFAFLPESLELIERSTTFLHETKSIAVAALPKDAVVGQFAREVLSERGLEPPVAEIRAASAMASK